MADYLEHIEWEGLFKPCEIDDVTPSEGVPPTAEKIKIWRDESYKIKSSIFGVSQKKDTDGSVERKPGQRVATFLIQGSSHYKIYEYELNQCYVGSMRKSFSREKQITYEADLHFHQMTVKANLKSEVEWLTDWYLNGPENLLYPRGTERKKIGNYERGRVNIDKGNKHYSGEYSEQDSCDYAYIETNDVKFLLTRVPKRISPTWSENVGIEYRTSLGCIPTIEMREGISEIVSFVIGRHLMHIGSTEYDVEGRPIKQMALSPWYSNAVHICNKPDLPPIELSHKWELIEEILGKIVPRYLNLRNDLNLSPALWRYWISKNTPIGANLPILAAGIEILAQAWFASKESQIKGAYMKKDDYDKLLEEEFEKISQKLKNEKYCDNMIGRIKNAFNMGVNDRLLIFFDEIGLKIGEVEKSAIKARNLMAHGYVPLNDSEWDKMIQKTYVYDTLFNRAVLKILGYEGNYIDRSVLGWPERHIDIPMGS